ncbi:hypothetical protein HG536_0A01840 [Torulaspora globosa]|uniref:Amino acid permease/ SLC12A domain-containing protein n=1 Tax=Torulaspora globosa TaxID=48254 RepID=A0A7G3ZA31_9SACH|nr:uncharacterized protein HG536_0A01840 [Torulaspora globosa]QLL30367.1 hypothetical protein HG536_0A01840 [Torulaspora globosa]
MMLKSERDVLIPKDGGKVDLENGKTADDVGYGSFSSMETEIDKSGILIDAFIEVPQGRHLGLFSTMVLFVSRIVGSGIFATPSSIFVNCGGNTVIYFGVWLLAALLSFAGLFLFLEFGSWLPRSGGRKNFLEQAYTKPRLMMSVTFAAFTVLTGFTMSNAIVFGKYFLSAVGFQGISDHSSVSKYISIAAVVVGVIIHGTSVKTGVRIQNFLGGMKFLLIAIMCLLGFYSIFYRPEAGEKTISSAPIYEFHDEGTLQVSSLAAAFINAFFCFTGWDSVHAVASEIKNPVRTLKIAGPLSLFICFLCYTMMNLAYINVLTYEEIKQAGPLVGSVLFAKLFGPHLGARILSLSVAISTGSNILVVLYGVSRMNQEVFREGYLPFSIHLASNKPWNSPLPALLVCGILSVTWLTILPSEGASYDYLVSMEGYGNQFFLLLIAVGIFIYRRKRKGEVPSTRASSIGVCAIILVSIYLMAAPFFGKQASNNIAILPPYQVTALMLILLCFAFWFVKFLFLPKVLGYELKQRIVTLDDGLAVTKWIKCDL